MYITDICHVSKKFSQWGVIYISSLTARLRAVMGPVIYIVSLTARLRAVIGPVIYIGSLTSRLRAVMGPVMEPADRSILRMR